MDNWSIKTAETIMERTPILSEDKGYNGKWSYDYGVVLKGFQLLWEKTGDERFLSFIKTNLDVFVTEDGDIKNYRVDEYNIDHVNTGKLLFVLYRETKDEKYRKAADLLYQQLTNHPRTSEGAFWHKEIYPYQIWLDGLYMGTPFYAEYIKEFGQTNKYEDIMSQFEISYKHLLDEETGLLIHAWDEKKVQPWADKETGLSHHFWSRSIGWYLMAAVDTYELLEGTAIDRSLLETIVKETLSALVKYQSPDSGVWYQVTNEVERKGNYLEASGSSMFVYAMAKGLRLGILNSKDWGAPLKKSYQGLLDEFVLVTKEGWVNLNKNCMVAGLGGADQRDGSFAYYISEPIICNDQKGVGAFLQALVETEEVLHV
ncbi:glycosyl hydrolase [Enterococcus sp. AZ194]|uniref:glycoside hydrolase family 88/105 protein n=1 Tax=Enterococcus sp. AZ194 TaxID=2774629 RepID=UPI003F1ED2C9